MSSEQTRTREINAEVIALRALATGYRAMLSEAVGALLQIETETEADECRRIACDALDAIETDPPQEA